MTLLIYLIFFIRTLRAKLRAVVREMVGNFSSGLNLIVIISLILLIFHLLQHKLQFVEFFRSLPQNPLKFNDVFLQVSINCFFLFDFPFNLFHFLFLFFSSIQLVQVAVDALDKVVFVAGIGGFFIVEGVLFHEGDGRWAGIVEFSMGQFDTFSAVPGLPGVIVH